MSSLSETLTEDFKEIVELPGMSTRLFDVSKSSQCSISIFMAALIAAELERGSSSIAIFFLMRSSPLLSSQVQKGSFDNYLTLKLRFFEHPPPPPPCM